MSGVFRAVGKIFKKAISAVKKIAPIAIPIAAALFTGGAALPGISAALGAGGAAATAGTAAAATAATGGTGLFGFLGKVLTPELVGNVITGAAGGYAEGKIAEERENQGIRAEERAQAQYKGLGDALSWDADPALTDMVTSRPPQGLAPVEQPEQPVVQFAAAEPAPASQWNPSRRRGLGEIRQAKPTVQYNRETGRIERV